MRLNSEELAAWKMLAGFSDSFITAKENLEKRAKAAGPGVWRDLCLMRKTGERICNALFDTFPENKKNAIQASWERLRARVDELPPMGLPGGEMKGHITVPLEALLWVVKTVIDWECTTCMKKGAETKHCELRRKLEALYQFDLPDVQKGVCPFCTMACHEDMRRIGA